MYITVLNFEEGKTYIYKVEDDIDCDEFVSSMFKLGNIEWMSSKDLNLETIITSR
jgi:hypothetical protein